MNLGHAFRLDTGAPVIDGVRAALHIVQGKSPLAARKPLDSAAVKRAEAILKVKGGVVYTFAGCLHPDLGTIGLIIRSKCGADHLEGATKCDSGGLAGGYGAFAHIPPDDVEKVLLALSYLERRRDEWPAEFAKELAASYPGAEAYIAGDVPRYTNWKDARSDCFDAYDRANWPPDRRLWTWEIRLDDSPKVDDFIAIAFSHEAFKYVELLRAAGEPIPVNVRVIVGDVSPGGVHYFSDRVVQAIFCE